MHTVVASEMTWLYPGPKISPVSSAQNAYISLERGSMMMPIQKPTVNQNNEKNKFVDGMRNERGLAFET
ncbi:CLUMA_CG018429, isoform A [Clunio marinus]|uniref:CLUMA_CG018429, isoform A n=1 Tax=Clunio marinus TaxID=568069 RepID=A0A1J1IZ75_9DIPT|nr:CLUMA_CG018429, isoform A [Clunio marinus]